MSELLFGYQNTRIIFLLPLFAFLTFGFKLANPIWPLELFHALISFLRLQIILICLQD